MATKEKKGGLTKLDETKLIEKLSKEVRFQPKELKRLVTIYKKYLKGTWYMDASTFSEFMYNSFGFNEEFFIKRVFIAADTNNDDRIDLEEFIRMVAIMLRGARIQKIQFCFKCYDLSENNELTRDDIVALLVEGITESPYKEVPPDDVRDLADMYLSKVDLNRDGVISFDEFKSACMKDWLLTLSLGVCLPDHRYRAAFLILLETEHVIDSDDIDENEII